MADYPKNSEYKGVSSQEQEREEKKEHKLSLEFAEALFESCEYADEGQDGIIMRLKVDELSEDRRTYFESQGLFFESDTAVKMLKLYKPGTIFHEYEAQKEAHDILQRHASRTAIVPKPYIHGTFEVTERILDKIPHFSDHEEVELLLMEWVPGVDIERQLYATAYEQLFPGEEASFRVLDDLRRAVSAELLFEDDMTERGGIPHVRSQTKNAQKLLQYLTRRGKFVNPFIIDRLLETAQVLEKNGIRHNDLHARNVIVDGDLFGENAETKVYVIDFGRTRREHRQMASEVNEEERTVINDDRALAQTLTFNNAPYKKHRESEEIRRAKEQQERLKVKKDRAQEIHVAIVKEAMQDPEWREKRKRVWKESGMSLRRMNAYNRDRVLEDTVTYVIDSADYGKNPQALGRVLDMVGLLTDQYHLDAQRIKRLLVAKGLPVNETQVYLDHYKRQEQTYAGTGN